ncbi:MAG: pyridoxamine 5'-phosphate oxidase family protein [Propionibacteriaceae bacterium]|jgi:nitroimidazol reductase NimA-like FMN-containing flavoprotein (pyridoxamine 5'-phosphate oxidase superfamily)|nr:pyridoxamine 5'-phosphate oxidase family protein [Propionibacteriaceae bacterium]
MADNPSSPVTVLSSARSWDLLASQRLGRVFFPVDGRPEIFPVNYIVDGETLVFRTAEGTKLDSASRSQQVAFEVDTWDIEHGYSVVARGTATPITDPAEIAHVETLKLKPWVPTAKTTFVRIAVSDITGRRFAFGPDPIGKYR